MAVSLTVLKEAGGEPRVSATPETVKKMTGLGIKVTVEAGAGAASGFEDAAYKQAGATVTKALAAVLKKSDVVLGVRAPAAGQVKAMKSGTVLIASLSPYQNTAGVKSYAAAKIQAMAMELMPRITRAQSMDILSSQSNLAGYKAVLDATAEYGRALPMMMTAAGTVRPRASLSWAQALPVCRPLRQPSVWAQLSAPPMCAAPLPSRWRA